MAENTTKDIWNDDDGEREEGKKRGHLLRNFLIFLLVLIAVLGLVLVAAWRDGTGFDALRRYFAYGTEAVGGEKIVYRYDTDNTNRFERSSSRWRSTPRRRPVPAAAGTYPTG